MTEDEYYKAAAAVGLRKGQFAATWFTVNGDPISVPPALGLSPAARQETIEALKERVNELLEAKLERQR